MILRVENSMTLIQANPGQTVRIISFKGGIGLEHKLRQLGLVPGDNARVLRYAPLGGPVMVEVDGRSIALGLGVASQVLVEADL
jgi:ferrous iron transport protein A